MRRTSPTAIILLASILISEVALLSGEMSYVSHCLSHELNSSVVQLKAMAESNKNVALSATAQKSNEGLLAGDMGQGRPKNKRKIAQDPTKNLGKATNQMVEQAIGSESD